MELQGAFQIVLFLVVLLALAYPLGRYLAWIFTRERADVVERGFLRLLGREGGRDQTWKQYAITVVGFGVVCFLLLYGLLRAQGSLFLNPDHMTSLSWPLAVNTAVSFVTNTNWQYYGGESTMSYLSQMSGLGVENFISAGVGLAVLAAVVRGVAGHGKGAGEVGGGTLGNFWRDLYRACVYVLLPLSVILAVVLIWQGVPQTFAGHVDVTTLQGGTQSIARGPVASQMSIMQLGTNGGGYYNTNSATPLENPTGFSDFADLLAILLIPAAQVFMFGRMVKAKRHAWMVYTAMFVLMAIGITVATVAEQAGSSVLRDSGVSIAATSTQSGGNMMDKEIRFGIDDSALWDVVATDTGNGSVNSGIDAYTPAGGAVPLVNMFTGEVIYGGVGTGMISMIFYIVIAVFIAGLMVGRTPEWLGKKIQAREIKYAALGALFVPTMVLIMTAIAIGTEWGKASIFNPGVHGFTETLYAYTSQANNNGSAFAGYGLTNFSAVLGTIDMTFGRWVPMVSGLALAGALVKKRTAPASAGTFRTDGATFVVLLIAVIVLTAGLMILPALSLGPIAEGLMH
jgi:potassium-transporting ATPase potassium-binding subunit